MSSPGDGQLINYLVRMIVPLKREFGRQLDVAQFMRDASYAESVLADALASQDPRLRDYASYVKTRLGGARNSAPPAAAPADPPARAESRPGEPTEAELRARVMKKYTGGLR